MLPYALKVTSGVFGVSLLVPGVITLHDGDTQWERSFGASAFFFGFGSLALCQNNRLLAGLHGLAGLGFLGYGLWCRPKKPSRLELLERRIQKLEEKIQRLENQSK
jgi:hypothetical protein